MIGCIEKKRVKCGRENCKCASGQLHGPYYYLRLQIGGRRFRRYLKSSEASEIRNLLTNIKIQRQQAKAEVVSWKQLLRSTKPKHLGDLIDVCVRYEGKGLP